MTPGKRPVVSRRERPAKPALTREGIVAAAIRVMQAEGLDRVTMRRLAQELDTGAASLYVYVRNTAELHAAMLEELLAAVDLSPVTAAGDWRERLKQVLWSYTIILFEQPGLALSVLVTRPSGPAYLSLAEGILWTCCCTSRRRAPPSRPPGSGQSTRKTRSTRSPRRCARRRPTPIRRSPRSAPTNSCPGRARTG
jgi:AcrR family transcriptional regulator